MLTFISQNDTQIIFIISAFLGGITHYLKKYLKGETSTKIYQWFGKANLPATVYTFITFTFAVIGAITSGVIDPNTTFLSALYSGFVTGFAIDAGFNSDEGHSTGEK